MKKMNNKGFSLVELIVVVLIMAIIAVALAPQVMKWVENSRKSTDIENYNALVEACNVASTNEAYLKKVDATGDLVEMTSTGTSVKSGSGKTELAAILSETLPGYTNTKITSSWAGPFQITVKKVTNTTTGVGIEVVRTAEPVKDFS